VGIVALRAFLEHADGRSRHAIDFAGCANRFEDVHPAHSTMEALGCRAMRRSLMLDPKLAAIGVCGGLLSGLLGVGGGVVMVPLLVLWASYGQRDAHAISLGAIIPISIAGIATYGIAGEVRWWDALALAAGSIVGAQVGVGVLTRIDERLLKVIFGGFLIGVAALLGVKA
jgi:uncharacterized protein